MKENNGHWRITFIIDLSRYEFCGVLMQLFENSNSAMLTLFFLLKFFLFLLSPLSPQILAQFHRSLEKGHYIKNIGKQREKSCLGELLIRRLWLVCFWSPVIRRKKRSTLWVKVTGKPSIAGETWIFAYTWKKQWWENMSVESNRYSRMAYRWLINSDNLEGQKKNAKNYKQIFMIWWFLCLILVFLMYLRQNEWKLL